MYVLKVRKETRSEIFSARGHLASSSVRVISTGSLWLHKQTSYYILARLHHDVFQFHLDCVASQVFFTRFLHLVKFILSSLSEVQSYQLLPPKQSTKSELVSKLWGKEPFKQNNIFKNGYS